jgi:hypothetical protein
MSWQEKMVHTAARTLYEADKQSYDPPWDGLADEIRTAFYARVEAAFRKSLLLIEVTSAMTEAAWVIDDTSSTGDAITAALVACAKERPQG